MKSRRFGTHNRERPTAGALVPYGMSAKEYGTILQWARRRAKYGESGGKYLNTPQPQSTCKKGHPIIGENVYVEPKRGTKRCAICESLRNRKGRPEWVVIGRGYEKCKVNVAIRDKAFNKVMRKLRAAVIRSHPDKEKGTHAKFLKAKKSLDYFVEQQSKWYAQFGLQVPDVNRYKKVKDG